MSELKHEIPSHTSQRYWTVPEAVVVKPVADQPALLMEKDGERVLVVADLHLGWEECLSHQGIHLPSPGPRLLEKPRKIINYTPPRRLILLGQSKHAVSKDEPGEGKD